MKFSRAGYLMAAVAILATGVAQADPKPKGAKNADGQMVANMYAGRTSEWKGCKGGIYYGGKWQAQAYCSKNGESAGIGTWSVNRKGVLCWDLTWYWPQGDSVGSKKQDGKECIYHLVDGDGQMWRKWNDDADWWRVDADNAGIKGFKLKGKVNRLRKKLGV